MDIYEILWISTDIMYTYKHIQYRLEHLHIIHTLSQILAGSKIRLVANSYFPTEPVSMDDDHVW